MSSLLALPNELLQKIASELTFHALLNLGYVNQKLHLICNENFVVQHVARYCFVNTPGATESLVGIFSSPNRIGFDPEQMDWQEGASFLSGASIGETKFLGYAAQKFTDVIMSPLARDDRTLRKSQRISSYNISKWLPQLLVLNHPATLALEPKTLLHLYEEARNRCPGLKNEFRADGETVPLAVLHEQVGKFTNIAFGMCYIILLHLKTSRSRTETIRQFEEFFALAPSPVEPPSTELSESERLDSITEYLIKDLPQFTNTLTQTYAILLPIILRLAVEFPSGADSGTLPSPKKISFIKFMDIRAVYENLHQGFNKSHYGEMTSPQFLEGNWMGCHIDERGERGDRLSSRAHYMALMYGIRVVTRAPSEQDRIPEEISTIVDRQSGGVDRHGQFSLSGTISTTGLVNMIKFDILRALPWTWTGHVTPFGIVGYWQGLRYANLGGLFWIWKEEWH
jgi:hypothetical protein